METKTKKGAVISAVIADEKLTISVEGQEPLVLDPSAMSEVARTYAILHGMKQRIVDAAAIPRDTVTGASATPAEKYEAMKELVDHYMSGAEAWSPTRTGGGRGAAEGGVTLRALAAVYGMDNEAMKARVEAMAAKREMTTKAYLAIVATYPDVAAKIAEIKASRVAPDLAAGMLDELKGAA